MFLIERKTIKFVSVHMTEIIIVISTLLSLYIRYTMREYVSRDIGA